MSHFMQRAGASSAGFVVAIVGASGAVGVELVRCLEERDFPGRGAAALRLGPLGRQDA